MSLLLLQRELRVLYNLESISSSVLWIYFCSWPNWHLVRGCTSPGCTGPHGSGVCVWGAISVAYMSVSAMCIVDSLWLWPVDLHRSCFYSQVSAWFFYVSFCLPANWLLIVLRTPSLPFILRNAHQHLWLTYNAGGCPAWISTPGLNTLYTMFCPCMRLFSSNLGLNTFKQVSFQKPFMFLEISEENRVDLALSLPCKSLLAPQFLRAGLLHGLWRSSEITASER